MAIQVLEKINLGNLGQIKNKRKELEKKRQEQGKKYGYIGMEAYSLYKKGKLNCQELNVYFQEMESVEREIKELEAEKESVDGNRICSCGCTLLPQQRFCPNCGKLSEQEKITCTCGSLVESGMQFCPNCGKSMKEAEGGVQKPDVGYIECICGAKVAQGQFMCMECGRKIE